MWQSSNRTQEAVSHRPPRKAFVPGPRTASTRDHNGEHVRIAWVARESYDVYAEKLPPFPFQVYILSSAEKTLQDLDFPPNFVDLVERTTFLSAHAHFEFYSSGFNNILACTAHQRREVESRNRNAIWPRLISSWAGQRGWGYKGLILVIDRDQWESNGVIVAEFGAHGLRHEEAVDLPGGDETVLWAERKYMPTDLRSSLLRAWSEVGHTWAQSDLERHNRGGFSPALYPAVDPSAHHDAEHDEEADVDAEPLTGESHPEPMETDDCEAANPEVTMEDLSKSPQVLEGLKNVTYQGHAGWETTSVWKASLSKTRPPFAFTLYLASDTLPFAAEALFASLDRELLSNAAWTLDIVRNVPDIQSALHHYSHETRCRTPARTEKRLKCVRMLLEKICAASLPEELLQLMEELLVPPTYPTYSAPPHRVFHDMFLFLDSSAQLTGPRVIYANHYRDHHVVTSDEERPVNSPSQPKDPILKLHVTDLQSWRLVSDELHIVWSLCSPRLKILPTDLPWFSMGLDIPSIFTLSPHFQRYEEHNEGYYAPASLTLHGAGPITVHDPRSLSDELWHEGVEITDVDKNTKLPTVPLESNNISDQRTSSWSEDPMMRSRDLEDDGSGAMLMTVSLQEEKPCLMPSRYEWWLAQYEAGLLEHNHDYIVSVRNDCAVKRWTYGSVPGLKGPYNLPPIPVHGEKECRFKFIVTGPEVDENEVDEDES